MSARRTLLPFVLAALSIAGGCFRPNSITCPDGSICPPGTTCGPTPEHHCVTAAETRLCTGQPDGTPCTVEGQGGRCLMGICDRHPFCGDGVKNLAEQCDGADLGGASCDVLGFYNERPGLGCTQACTFDTSGCSGICGDGVVDKDREECDRLDLNNGTCAAAGFSSSDKPSCNANCRWDYSQCSGYCGDRSISGDEMCDGLPPSTTSCLALGFDRGQIGCSASCQPSVDGCGVFEVDWSKLPPSGSPLAIWAAGVDDLFAVGVGGVASRWNGTVWTSSMVSGVDSDLYAVWGRGPTDVFAVGARGTILHWNGSTWSSMASGTTDDLLAVWTTDQADLFVGGTASVRRWDGVSWTSSSTPARINGIWGSGPRDVYAVGDAASILHSDGTTWNALTPRPPPFPGGGPGLSSVWGSGPGDVIAVAPSNTIPPTGLILQLSSVNPPITIPAFPGSVFVVAGGGAGDEFIGGNQQLFHRLGAIWQWEQIALPGPVDVRAIAVATREVFILDRAGEIFLLDRPGVTCTGPERNCRDGWDNDCNGLPDALDPNCRGKVDEQCANGLDDNGDGLPDCADPDCASFPSCKGSMPTTGGKAGTGGTAGAAGAGGLGGAGGNPPGTDGTSF